MLSVNKKPEISKGHTDFLVFYDNCIDKYIIVRYNMSIEVRYIALKGNVYGCTYKKVYVPMTETSFYILLCLRTPNHGYGIVQKVKELTENEVVLGPGTMYGSLSKMEKDGLIHFIREEDKRKIYEITELGTEVLELELKRIRRLYRNAQEVTQ